MEAILLMRVLFLSVDLITFVRVMAGSLQWTKIASHLSLQNYDSVKTMQDLSKKNIRTRTELFPLNHSSSVPQGYCGCFSDCYSLISWQLLTKTAMHAATFLGFFFFAITLRSKIKIAEIVAMLPQIPSLLL